MDSLDELLEALGDAYTTYMTKEEYQNFLTAVNGESVVGIGVSVSSVFDEGYRIVSVLPDSPALEAGVAADDYIIGVDGVALTADQSPSSLIVGPSGHQVNVTFFRPSTQAQFDLKPSRRPVGIPLVHY